MCVVNGFQELEKIEFGGLTDFAVDNRYPDHYEQPTLEEMKNYISLVIKIKSVVESKIKF